MNNMRRYKTRNAVWSGYKTASDIQKIHLKPHLPSTSTSIKHIFYRQMSRSSEAFGGRWKAAMAKTIRWSSYEGRWSANYRLQRSASRPRMLNLTNYLQPVGLQERCMAASERRPGQKVKVAQRFTHLLVTCRRSCTYRWTSVNIRS